MFFPIETLREGQPMTSLEIRSAAAALLDPTVPDPAKAEFLRSLSAKGETPAEIAGLVEVFLEKASHPGLDLNALEGPVMDVCGTGGDKLQLFNVSTTVMFVAAAAGAVVVKHGNRGITSRSGGADVLEALGIRLDLPADRFCECVKRTGLGFLFAPACHPAFKVIAPVRQELAREGTRTVFNLLGPLLNPVRPPHQLIGVFLESLPPVFADILTRLGRKRAWVVHGTTAEGAAMDELSTLGPTLVCKVERGREMERETVFPEDLGMQLADLGELRGGEAGENAAILVSILDGSERGPKRDLVLLNAGASLVVAGLVPDLGEGVALAREQIESGAALRKLEHLRQVAG
jgi:anthranilate phosphoribosyltransferase